MKSIKPITLAVSMAATLTFGAVGAQVESAGENEIDLAKAYPELNEPAPMRSGTGIRCFVDTPALDPWQSPNCFNVGFARTTSALFNVFNLPSNFNVLWSDSRCNEGFTSCSLPISFFQQITVTATVLDLDNGTFVQLTSTASYEGFF